MTEDRGAQTKSEVKRLTLSTNFCHYTFVHENNPITIVLRNQTFALCEGLALQKVPDDELATYLDIEA